MPLPSLAKLAEGEWLLGDFQMKRRKNLYPSITSFENLYQAFKKAARGKRSQPNVAAFECPDFRSLGNFGSLGQARRSKPGGGSLVVDCCTALYIHAKVWRT